MILSVPAVLMTRQQNIALNALRMLYGVQLVVSVKRTGLVMTVASTPVLAQSHASALVHLQTIVMVQQQRTVLHAF